MLQIFYNNQDFLAITKPHDFLVHSTSMAKNIQECVLQLWQDQLGYPVYPVLRLDRKTGGILLFGKQERYWPKY